MEKDIAVENNGRKADNRGVSSNSTSSPTLASDRPFTLSMCGCQYSSCRVLATVPLILEKNVGLVRYIEVGFKSNVSAIIAWILPRTSLYRVREKTKQT